MNDEEKIKKAATFIDSFLVRTNTNLKKCAASKDSLDNESVIEILESQKRVLEKIKEILTSQITDKDQQDHKTQFLSYQIEQFQS